MGTLINTILTMELLFDQKLLWLLIPWEARDKHLYLLLIIIKK